jgi:hypothetical protein
MNEGSATLINLPLISMGGMLQPQVLAKLRGRADLRALQAAGGTACAIEPLLEMMHR